MLNDSDLNNHLQVAVVGTDIVEHLLGGTDPIGQEIRVDGWTYQVIGVGKKKGKTLGQSADNYVLIPVTVYLKQFGSHNDSIRIWGKATATGVPLDQAIDEARVALRAHRHDRVGEDDSFDIETNASLLSIWSGLSDTFFMATIGIAGVSLVVGGIVIMNIMLVSVTERTREIGIRLAVGARGREVMLQFLVEAIALSCLGGLLGVSLGLVGSVVAARFLEIPFTPDVRVIAVAFIFSGAVGIGFGFFPARKAALLDPIDALRHE
jgi:putative ABC transport system permease protein